MDNLKSFNAEALAVFEEKGSANSVKVRRVMQLTSDLSKKKFSDLRILDLGCGEGVYSLEAGMRGAKVLGIDGRDTRLVHGRKIAADHGLSNVELIVDDVRNVTADKYGKFDVIYFLGLLYHLDEPEVFTILKNIYNACNDLLIIDSSIALSTPLTVKHDGKEYYGVKYVEHQEGDSQELVVNKRVMHSIGNNKSFMFSKKSLVRFLTEIGFTSVLECYSPMEPNKLEGRITLVAIKGDKQKIASYPWLNGLGEDDVTRTLKEKRTIVPFALGPAQGIKQKMKRMLDSWLEKKGYVLKRKLRDE